MTERIWIVDDDRSIRWVLDKALSREGYRVRCFVNADEPLALLKAGHAPPDVVVTDIRMPGTDGLDTLKWLQQRLPELPVIVITAHSDLDAAVASYREGAFEYVPKPFDLDEVKSLIGRAISKASSHKPPATGLDVPDIIGEAPAMQEVFRAIGRLSHSSVTVLINGASGTGKERVANTLHRHSLRAEQPFVALNMAAIPRELIESELFGHEKGAFTGANARRVGRFEQADGGTLFLDEIGDMPFEVQTRLLRLLQEDEFYRVGGAEPVKVDVRIIAATHQNLEQLVEARTFREDLFYRLNVVRVHLPNLARRGEDIKPLAEHFLASIAREMDVEQKHLDEDTLAFFQQLPWPGNVRQLENVCRWLTVMVSGSKVHLDDLPDELRGRQHPTDDAYEWQAGLRQWAEQALAAGNDNLLATAQPVLERILVQAALQKTGGRRRDAARLVGWGRNTLTRKIKEFEFKE